MLATPTALPNASPISPMLFNRSTSTPSIPPLSGSPSIPSSTNQILQPCATTSSDDPCATTSSGNSSESIFMLTLFQIEMYNNTDTSNGNVIIERMIQNLEKKFIEIADRTFDEIHENKPDVERFRARLVSLSFKYQEQHKEFFQILIEHIEKDTTIDHIWIRLSGYWSFLNYTLLEILVHKFGSQTLKDDMGDYMKQLKEFRRKTRLCQFAKYCNKINKQLPEHDLQEFVVKLKQRWDECTLQDLEELKENITQQFFLPSFVTSIRSIRPGSIIVTWTLPTLIASALERNLKNIDISPFCKENGIKCILIDGKDCKYSPKERYSVYLKDWYSKMEGKNLYPFKLAHKLISRKDANEFTNKTFKGDVDDFFYEKYDMTEEKIGCPDYKENEDKQPFRLVLIEGAADVGKTTFSEQFCHKWSQGQCLKDHTLLVLLSLQNNKVRSAKRIPDLFLHPHLQQAITEEVESTQGEGVALLLDGWDKLEEERREKSSIFLDLVCGHVLPKATIIVTSQPWASKQSLRTLMLKSINTSKLSQLLL